MPLQYATGRVRIEWSSSADGDLVKIAGQLDELAELAKFCDRLGDPVRFDLEQVTFVNSIGLREWVKTLRALEARNARVILSRCSEAVVHHMNMVLAARGNAAIESFFAPYECEKCGHCASLCLDVAEHLDTFRSMEMPTRPCSACGATARMADLPESYLLFLES